MPLVQIRKAGQGQRHSQRRSNYNPNLGAPFNGCAWSSNMLMSQYGQLDCHGTDMICCIGSKKAGRLIARIDLCNHFARPIYLLLTLIHSALTLPRSLSSTMQWPRSTMPALYHLSPPHLPEVSTVDIILPGLAIMSPTIQQLLKGNLNSYTGPLCTCGKLVSLVEHTYEYLWKLVDKFLGPSASSETRVTGLLTIPSVDSPYMTCRRSLRHGYHLCRKS